MNEQITTLIEQLALKLGTTAEYLWAILIAQAPISAMITLFYFIIFSLIGFILYRIHVYLMKPHPDYNQTIRYDVDNDGILKFMIIFGSIIWFIVYLITIFHLKNVFIGFFNPEYWALKEILSQLK